MILTPHALVGAALANSFPSHPALGLTFAFLSHYLLDIIPHAEYSLKGFIDEEKEKVNSIFKNFKSVFKPLSIIGLDFIFGLSVSIFFFVKDKNSLYLTIFGVLLAVLPDFLQLVYLKSKNKFWTAVQNIHEFFHGENKYRHELFRGTLTQLITIAIFLGIYFLLSIN